MGILKSFGKTAEDLMDEADKVLAEPDLPISKVSKVEDESHVEPKTDADTDSDLPDPDVPNTATVRDPEPSTRRDDLDGPSAEDGADVTTITPKKRKKKKKEKKKGKQQFAPASDIDRHLKQYSADDVRDMTSLHKSMTKVTLSTSRWTAKIKDPRIAKAAADAGHANAESFDGRKSLVAGAEQEVKKINSLIDKAKTSHYRLTLPWSTVSGKEDGRRQGPRVMPNLRYFEYVEEMAKHASAVKEAIDEFAPKYEQIKEIARGFGEVQGRTLATGTGRGTCGSA
jgi:hypothetical protein